MFNDITEKLSFDIKLMSHQFVRKNVIICGRDDNLKCQMLNAYTGSPIKMNRKCLNFFLNEIDHAVIETVPFKFNYTHVPINYSQRHDYRSYLENSHVIVYVLPKDFLSTNIAITPQIMLNNYEENCYLLKLISSKELLGKPILIIFNEKITKRKDIVKTLDLTTINTKKQIKIANFFGDIERDRVVLKRFIQNIDLGRNDEILTNEKITTQFENK